MMLLNPSLAVRIHFAGLSLQALMRTEPASSNSVICNKAWAMADKMMQTMPDEAKQLLAADVLDYMGNEP